MLICIVWWLRLFNTFQNIEQPFIPFISGSTYLVNRPLIGCYFVCLLFTVLCIQWFYIFVICDLNFFPQFIGHFPSDDKHKTHSYLSKTLTKRHGESKKPAEIEERVGGLGGRWGMRECYVGQIWPQYIVNMHETEKN